MKAFKELKLEDLTVEQKNRYDHVRSRFSVLG